MKHTIASLTIGACMLLASAGVLMAANPHTALPSVNKVGRMAIFFTASGCLPCRARPVHTHSIWCRIAAALFLVKPP